MSPPRPKPGRAWQSLQRRADFLRLQQQGQKWVTPHFIIFCHNPGDLSAAQLGVTVTKKVGNAVIRNRIRRRLRAVADRISLPTWQISLIARNDSIECDIKELEKNLLWALKRIQVRYEEQGVTN